MNRYAILRRRAEDARPVKVGLIGAGKFGTMFLAQARRTPGLHVLGVADSNPKSAHGALSEAGFVPDRCADDLAAAGRDGTTAVLEDADSLIAGALPIGLAHGVTLGQDVPQGAVVPRSAVQLDPTDGAVAARAEMERMFARDTP